MQCVEEDLIEDFELLGITEIEQSKDEEIAKRKNEREVSGPVKKQKL